MTERLTRMDLQGRLHRASFDTESLDDQPGAAGLGLAASDRNGDGRIQGEAELAVLVDRLDVSDGRRDRYVTLVDRRGTRTAGAALLEALARSGADTGLHDVIKRARLATRSDPTVVFIGMQNDSARREIDAMRTRAPVLEITDRADGAERITVRRRTFDLTRSTDVRAFCRVLDLPVETSERVRTVLLGNHGNARRELASLALVLAPGERGLPIPSRLVISGHGDGTSFLGHDDDAMRDTDVVALALALPRAAAQIEHVHFASCQHGWEPRMDEMRVGFPQLVSAWGYTGFSPSGETSIAHERIWERDTRSGDARALGRASAAGSRRGENAAVWTAARGFDGSDARALSVVMDDINRAQPRLDGYLAGERELDDADLLTLYGFAQEVVQSSDYREQRPNFKSVAERRRDDILRLRFYDRVAKRFAHEYGAQISAAYAAVGLVVPDFAQLSRPQAAAQIAAFVALVGEHPAAVVARARDLLTRGLLHLDARLIPVWWI